MSTREPIGNIAFNLLIRSRYDLLIIILPVPLIVGFLVSVMTAVPVSVGVGTGGVPSALLLGYGLFIDDPSA
ncbi:hypothetical protein [Haloquadratum walsbyi]|mgnify:FL=1|uniref:Uncharacterized protein n=1 Tax=Haloquadratum walsbyi (strain DSM 16854 / JCM 12705 / C23) TaxID=768065 RepID=G0LMM7_HALWC|nr:hypothetical protein [Haloquadratum walsbyi]CCC41347.1 uncharacterized protein Hqrw_3600 [Haloquadratum walsbyi C23]